MKLAKAKEEAEFRRALELMAGNESDGMPALYSLTSSSVGTWDADVPLNTEIVSDVAYTSIKGSYWLRGVQWVGNRPIEVLRPRFDPKREAEIRAAMTKRKPA